MTCNHLRVLRFRVLYVLGTRPKRHYGKFRIPVPDPQLPGPGAGYPAAGPGAGCRLPGRPFFGLFPPKKFLKMHRDTPGIKKKSGKKITKNHKNYHFLFGPAGSKQIFLGLNGPGFPL